MSLDEFNASRRAVVNQVCQVKTTPEIQVLLVRNGAPATCSFYDLFAELR